MEPTLFTEHEFLHDPMSAHYIYPFECRGEMLYLHAGKAVFWERAGMLILADMHVGKASHFRKHGIAIPLAAERDNLQRLAHLIADFGAGRVLFLGDLFHSTHNASWEAFVSWKEQFPAISFELVPGNHDILSQEKYREAGLILHPEIYREGPFSFIHAPLPEPPEDSYYLAGHIHPGIHLQHASRHWLRLPCFYFGPQQGVLPAFGSFTGLALVEVQDGSRIFAIGKEQVFPL